MPGTGPSLRVGPEFRSGRNGLRKRVDILLMQKPCFCEAVPEVLPSAITPFVLIQVVRIETERPELEHRFGRRADRREHDVASTRGSLDAVVLVVRPASVPAMRQDGIPRSHPKKTKYRKTHVEA